MKNKYSSSSRTLSWDFLLTSVAFSAQGRGPPMHSRNLQYFCCKKYGHIAANCPYYKKNVALSKNVVSTLRIVRPDHFKLLLFLLQQILSYLALPSNHMANAHITLCHDRPYVGQFAIQTTSRISLLITTFGNAS